MKVESGFNFYTEGFGDLLSDLCRIITIDGSPMLFRDRFDYLSKYSNVNWLTTEDKLFRTDKTLEDCIEDKALEILSLGEKINILYSGGVDSCGMVSAFMDNLDKVRLFLTEESIKENPKFFDWIKNKVEYHICNNVCKEVCQYDGVILNGHPADQLFGSMINTLSLPQYNDMPYKDVLNRLSEDGIISFSNRVEDVADTVECYSKFVGFEIKTFKEMEHFLNFALRYSWIIHHISYDLKEYSRDKCSISFYHSQDFQNWCLSNFEINNRLNPLSPLEYKKPLKEYIQKKTGMDCIWELYKKPSWKKTQVSSSDYQLWVLTDEGDVLFNITSDMLSSIRKISPFTRRSRQMVYNIVQSMFLK